VSVSKTVTLARNSVDPWRWS